MTDMPVRSDFDPATGIATLTFDVPAAMNVLDEAMARSFGAAVAALRGRGDVRCVVLRGSGRAFMAGGDIRAFAGDTATATAALAAILKHMHPAIVDLRAMDAPVLAAVNGSAAGAGFSLVLGADHVVAKASSRFVLAYDRLGTVPDCGGSWFLVRRIGRAAAMRLMFAGGPLSAERAQALGIVDDVVDDDAFEAHVAAVAARLAAGPTRAFGQFKRLVDADLPLAAHLEAERQAFTTAMHSADFTEAVAAFLGKRDPVFTGA